MHPILISFGPVTIYSWGFMVAIAFAVAIWLAAMLAKTKGIDPENIIDIAAVVLISSLLGARLFYVLGFWNEFIGHPAEILAIWEGGMVFYGGLIFGFIALVLMAKAKKMSIITLLDAAAPAVALGYAIGRIGCFLRGCCFGVECNLPWAMHFPESAGLRHPTQMYSFAAGLLIFAALIFLYYRNKKAGNVFIAGLILYSLYRFIIEFFRFSPSYWLWFTPSQWISLVLLISITLYIYLRDKKSMIIADKTKRIIRNRTKSKK